jgi:hypothetical protein
MVKVMYIDGEWFCTERRFNSGKGEHVATRHICLEFL